MANRWGNSGNSGRIYFLGVSKITADGDCSDYIKRHLLLGRKAMTNLLLSCVSHVRLCVTPETVAHQAPLSLGFFREEHWSGLPFPSPMHKVKSESEVVQSCPTLCNSMDCNPPGSSVQGIFQARVLEWGAIAFSVTRMLTSENNQSNDSFHGIHQ